MPALRGSKARQKLEISEFEIGLKSIKKDYPKETEGWFFYKCIFNFSKDEDFKELLTDEEKLIENTFSKIIELAKKLEEYLKHPCGNTV